MTRSRRILTHNIASLTVLQTINYLVPLITFPYLVHVLQPTHFGILSFVQSIVLYFDFFTDFGFNFSTTRTLAASRHNLEAVSRIFWSTIFAKAGLMCLSAMALAALVAFTPKLRTMSGLFGVSVLSLLGTTVFPLWLFQGLERLKLAAAAMGIARLLTIPAIMLLVKRPQDYVLAAAIQASVELAASIVVAPFLLRSFQIAWRRPSLSDIANTYKEAWPLFLSGSAFFFATYSATVILGAVSSGTQVGYFSAADKLIKAPIAALNPVGQALYPHIVSARKVSSSWAFRLIRKTFLAMAALSLLASASTLLLAGPLCQLLLGSSFRQSTFVLQCMAPLPILYGLLNVLGTQTMLVFNMDKTLTRIMFASALLGLPITFLLSFLFGAVGAAIASVVTTMLIVSAMGVSLHRNGLHIWNRPLPEPAVSGIG